MALDYGSDGKDSKYIGLPKVGMPPLTVEIKEIKKVEDAKYKFNFQEKIIAKLPDGGEMVGSKNAGWRVQIETVLGKFLNISNWSLFYAMKGAQVNDGDTIEIAHPAQGKWEVTVLKRSPVQASLDI